MVDIVHSKAYHDAEHTDNREAKDDTKGIKRRMFALFSIITAKHLLLRSPGSLSSSKFHRRQDELLLHSPADACDHGSLLPYCS
jgi:hypothetical protein